MTCAASAHHIEQNLSATTGVHLPNVNFATSRATVEYDPQETGLHNLVTAVESAGYRAAGLEAEASIETDAETAAREVEYRDARRKFSVAALLSLPVLVMAMSHGRI